MDGKGMQGGRNFWLPGSFYEQAKGSMTRYATRRNKAVEVKTVYNEKTGPTPDEPEQFVASIRTFKMQAASIDCCIG